MISTLLSFTPLILVTIFGVLGGIVIIHDARSHPHHPKTHKPHAKAKH